MSKAKIGLGIAAALLVAGGYGLYRLRLEANGFRNIFNTQYWAERRAGTDLYNAKEQILKHGNRSRNEVIITFDDGPHPESVVTILDTLKKYQVPATFFVVGSRVKQNPDLVKKMIDEGQEVGNHTQDHIRLDTLTLKQVEAEVRNCELNVEKASGRSMSLLRPPGMRFNPQILELTRRLGYTVIDWNVGAKDFLTSQKITDMTPEQAKEQREKLSPELITERVLRNVRPGSIILLHDNPITAKALPDIIEGVRAKGLEFVSTTKMLAELPHGVRVVANPTAGVKVSSVTR